jgi:hypothetical protein
MFLVTVTIVPEECLYVLAPETCIQACIRPFAKSQREALFIISLIWAHPFLTVIYTRSLVLGSHLLTLSPTYPLSHPQIHSFSHSLIS